MWIRTVAEGEAESIEDDDRLRDLYRQTRDPKTGQTDNILRVHSLHPQGMAAHWSLYRTVMSGTESLPKVEREMIALVVSRHNQCHY